MLYQLCKDLIHAVLLYHSMRECSLRPSLLWTVIYSPSSKSLKRCFLKKIPDLQHAAFIKADAVLLHCLKLALPLQDTSN